MVDKRRKQQPNAGNDALIPAAETPEWALEPTGAAEEFGFPTNYGLREKQTWMRQEAFLEQYAKCGKLIRAAEAAGMTIWAVEYWQKQDLYEFNHRLEIAHRRYGETIEVMIDDRLETPQGNRGSDPLLMFKAKAEMPEKYREDVKVIDQGAALQTWEMLKQLAMETHRQRSLNLQRLRGTSRTWMGEWQPNR